MTYVLDAGSEQKPVKIRYTEEHVSPTLLTYKTEVSVDGGSWKAIAEGKIIKVP